jgi:hypothetical protein
MLSNTAPVIDSLADSADPVVWGALTLTAVGVSDPDPAGYVANVNFYRESNGTPGLQNGAAGDELIGTDCYPDGGWKLNYWYPGLPPGTYTYYAQATDNEGAQSAEVSTTNTIQEERDHQIISGAMATVNATAGQSISLPVSYTTSTADNTVTGLGLRLHYNSSVLTYDGVSQVLSKSLFMESILNDDTSNLDDDPNTDKYVLLAWLDVSGNWPNLPLPTQLYVANFTVAGGVALGTDTQVRFTDSSSPGMGIESRPITVRFGDLPTISDVADQSTNEDGTAGPIGFTVGDTETPATSLNVTGSSSNASLVPDANIVFGGSGANRTVAITPAPNQFGAATITLTVTDGDGCSATDTFLFTVNSVNDPPVVGLLSDTPDPAYLGQDVTLTATGVADALDPTGSVSRVDFYRESNGTAGLQTGAGGDTSVGSDNDAADGWSASVATGDLALGAYTYYAQATDNEGLASAAASTTNTVQTPPDCQIVSDVASTVAGTAGQSISFPVRYTTSTGDNTLSGLGLRLHYDSSLLVYNGLSNVLASSLVGQQQPVDDTSDWDNDPETDKYVFVSWADTKGNWPNEPLPVELCSPNFIVADSAAEGVQTSVRFSASSTAPGYRFQSQPITVQVSGRVQDPPSLDADGNGTADALTDGLLILRYLFDPAGPWDYSDALGADATRTTRDAVKTFLDKGQATVLDVDGNGTPDALTDGILILRYLFNTTGAWNCSDSLGSQATRTARTEIAAFLDLHNPAVASASTSVVETPIAASQTLLPAETIAASETPALSDPENPSPASPLAAEEPSVLASSSDAPAAPVNPRGAEVLPAYCDDALRSANLRSADTSAEPWNSPNTLRVVAAHLAALNRLAPADDLWSDDSRDWWLRPSAD